MGWQESQLKPYIGGALIHLARGVIINQKSDNVSLVGCLTCPACNAAERSPYWQDRQWQLFTCAGCGLIYLDPMPGPDLLAALYHNAYDDAQTGYFAKPDVKLRRSMIRLRIIRRFSKSGGGNFLDVGCNGGFMVEAARRTGFAAWGIEPDAVSLEYARKHFPGNQYFHGLIADFDPKDASGAPIRFDVAYCS
jgi:SAM-dependent methyltransferase